MTKKYIFHNFTDKDFTGYWNGKPYTFKPGVKRYYQKGIAEHFAKHLTNQILTESDKERYTSPKQPEQVPVFMEVFNKALLIEEVPDEDNLDIDGGEVVNEPSMDIKVVKRENIDIYDASKNAVTGPENAPQIIGEIDDDEFSFEGNK